MIIAPAVQGKTENLPAPWPTCLLGDLEAQAKLVIKNGFSCGTHTTVGEGIPHLRPFNVAEDGRLSFKEVKRIPPQPGVETYGLLAEDILYNNTNSEELVGKCAYWPGRDGLHVLSNHMTILRMSSTSDLDARFLAFYLLWFWLSGSSRLICRRHVNQASIGLERMRQIEVPCPPFQEQQAIAYILSRIQAAVEVQDKIVATLKELKASTMAKLFREGLRGEPLKRTEIGEIPESWQVVRLKDIAKLITKGSSPNWQGFDYQHSGILFIRSQNVGLATLLLKEVAYLPQDFNRKEQRSILLPGDLLVNIVGASIGRAAVADARLGGANINQAVALVRMPLDQQNPYFFMHFLLSQPGLEQMRRQKKEIARANLSLEDVGGFVVPVPSRIEQDEIALALDSINIRMNAALQCSDALRSLFSSMLHLMMTGQVRVLNPGALPQ